MLLSIRVETDLAEERTEDHGTSSSQPDVQTEVGLPYDILWCVYMITLARVGQCESFLWLLYVFRSGSSSSDDFDIRRPVLRIVDEDRQIFAVLRIVDEDRKTNSTYPLLPPGKLKVREDLKLVS
ncbi:hypothetical protein LXL04_022150 [Taraxacum kok-saghyz]